MKIFKLTLTITLILSLLANSTAQGYLCPEALARGYDLRPAATNVTPDTEKEASSYEPNLSLDDSFWIRHRKWFWVISFIMTCLVTIGFLDNFYEEYGFQRLVATLDQLESSLLWSFALHVIVHELIHITAALIVGEKIGLFFPRIGLKDSKWEFPEKLPDHDLYNYIFISLSPVSVMLITFAFLPLFLPGIFSESLNADLLLIFNTIAVFFGSTYDIVPSIAVYEFIHKRRKLKKEAAAKKDFQNTPARKPHALADLTAAVEDKDTSPPKPSSLTGTPTKEVFKLSTPNILINNIINAAA